MTTVIMFKVYCYFTQIYEENFFFLNKFLSPWALSKLYSILFLWKTVEHVLALGQT